MNLLPRRLRSLALCAAGLMLLTACREEFAGGAACPVLCPEQGLDVRDTVLFPVVLDTTLTGFPLVGAEPLLVLADRGDTLRAAAATRFDTLLSSITRGADSAARVIQSLDTANLIFEVVEVPVASDSITVEIYDIDTTTVGVDTGIVRQLFRQDRLVTTRRFHRDSLKGVRRIPIPTSFLTPKVRAGQRVRFGIAVSSSASVTARMLTAEATAAPVLSYLARTATDTQTLSIVASSNVPESPGVAAFSLADYQVLLAGSPPPAGLLAVGGVPGSRSYLRFSIPEGLIEKNTIVRATLLLTQVPYRGADATDTVQVLARVVRATPVLDPVPGKAALLLGDVRLFPMVPLKAVPNDSGQVALQIASAIAFWRTDPDITVQRALVLQAVDEGLSPHAAYFLSSDPSVPQALRPRLQLSFVPRAGFGLP